MLLADSSVWIDHFRRGNTALVAALDRGRILGHPLVTGEIALGSLRNRTETLTLLDNLRQAPMAEPGEVRATIEARQLHSRGIGYVDACLLASVWLMPGTRLWTLDRRLNDVAEAFGLAA